MADRKITDLPALAAVDADDVLAVVDVSATETKKVTKAVFLAGITSGLYTPTVAGLTNVQAFTAYECTWMQIGSTVHVAGRVDIDPTASGDTSWTMTLPVPNDLTLIGDLAGVAARRSSSDASPGVIYASVSADAAEFRMYIGTTSATEVYFGFTYRF
tara:strand:+ start:257 stop:730 length:474 start_codon:yes stop_codon:yes gene_type:complete